MVLLNGEKGGLESAVGTGVEGVLEDGTAGKEPSRGLVPEQEVEMEMAGEWQDRGEFEREEEVLVGGEMGGVDEVAERSGGGGGKWGGGAEGGEGG